MASYERRRFFIGKGLFQIVGTRGIVACARETAPLRQETHVYTRTSSYEINENTDV